jgi:hypothetical protein
MKDGKFLDQLKDYQLLEIIVDLVSPNKISFGFVR